jgi:hypothetical protein
LIGWTVAKLSIVVSIAAESYRPGKESGFAETRITWSAIEHVEQPIDEGRGVGHVKRNGEMGRRLGVRSH